jgi:hypothetical protein
MHAVKSFLSTRSKKPEITMLELTVHMRPHRHERLNKAIYGDEYGLGVRKIDLILESLEPGYKILVPVTALYDQNSIPVIICDTLKREEWDILCEFVKEKRMFGICMTASDGKSRFVARLTVKGSVDGQKLGAMQVGFTWREPTAVGLRNRDSRLKTV